MARRARKPGATLNREVATAARAGAIAAAGRARAGHAVPMPAAVPSRGDQGSLVGAVTAAIRAKGQDRTPAGNDARTVPTAATARAEATPSPIP